MWSWSCPHPEWRAGKFGAEVISFAARAGETLLLIDPLLPEHPDAVLALIDAEAARAARTAILITVPYHVRSAERLWERLGRETTTIHGHKGCLKRLGPSAAGFEEIDPEAELPGGARAFVIGKPRRNEHPVHLPGHDAIVFGDAVVNIGGGLRLWAHDPISPKVVRFYRDRFNPTLEPLHDLGAERILTTHGPPVLSGGAAALRAATDAEPWYHHG